MNERELIIKCKKSNRKAQKQLFELYSETAIRLCYRYARNKHEAEDMMMEAFYKVFDKIKIFDINKKFSAWFNTIMINTAINYYKKESKYYYQVGIETMREVEVSDQKLNDIESKLSLDDLMNALNQLPNGQREIFNLYAIEGFKHKEIADKLEITESTVKTQYMKARLKLQNIIITN